MKVKVKYKLSGPFGPRQSHAVIDMEKEIDAESKEYDDVLKVLKEKCNGGMSVLVRDSIEIVD